MFSSLRVRNYRLFTVGQVVSNTGTWMQRIAQDWLVLRLTGSSAAVGVTVALQFLPALLLGLYGGVLADRWPGRRTLLVTQSAAGLTSLSLAVLTLSGQVELWHVYVTAFLLGVIGVVDKPARRAFVPELVGPADLHNAIALHCANSESARLAGPAVAGVLITSLGSGAAFLLNGLSYLAPIVGLLMMRTSELHRPSERRPRGRGELREGLRCVARRPELLWPVVLGGFLGTFAYNFPVWITAFVTDVFHAGPGTYGLLNTLMAGGSLLGALFTARCGCPRRRVLVGAALLFGLAEAVAALAPAFWVFAVLLVPVGALGLVSSTTANCSVQLAADPALRGRVVSVFTTVFMGGTPLGAALTGWITETYGARAGFLSGGLVSATAAVAVGCVLSRSAGVRLSVDPRRGRRCVTLVPRGRAPAAAEARAG
ncbi:MFS transporter [Streptomyces luteireticuli]|uniref:MFS transporter n=1 Tax=Streptomyces luteireticuli TaxID=173858 RepID=A0ABN0YWX1_9ACTN